MGGSAFDVIANAEFVGSLTVCFTVPDAEAPTETAFNALSLLSEENGALVDHTTNRNFAARQICATVNALTAFALVEHVDPQLPFITGLIVDGDGNALSGVGIHLTGTEDRNATSDGAGLFHFVNLTANGSYLVAPKQSGFIFNPAQQIFVSATGENTAAFIGTLGSFHSQRQSHGSAGKSHAGCRNEVGWALDR